MTIREASIESYLGRRVREAGGDVRKVQWIGRSHAPDRAVFLNGVTFVEVKRPGEEPRDGQYREMEMMLKHGVRCTWVNCFEHVDGLIEKLTRER